MIGIRFLVVAELVQIATMVDYTEEWVTAADGTKLYTRRYLPSGEGAAKGNWGVLGVKAGILFIHGFVEHVGRCDQFQFRGRI